MKIIETISKSFLNLLYPLHCPTCMKALEASNEFGVCDYCLSRIVLTPKPYCASCGRSLQSPGAQCAECRKTKNHFARAYAVCLYDGVLKELIHTFKYEGRLSLSKILVKLAVDFIRNNTGTAGHIDLVTFVPLHKKRLMTRGFNQSEILASGVARGLGIPFAATLEKTLVTRHQNELARSDRLVNLKGAFRVTDGALAKIKGLRILLIDDVMTTGATVNECARELIEAGAAEVRCLTLARGI